MVDKTTIGLLGLGIGTGALAWKLTDISNKLNSITIPKTTYTVEKDGDKYTLYDPKGKKILSLTKAEVVIQKGIDMLEDGGRLLIRKGVYYIEDTIVINKPIILEGEGSITLLKLKDNINKPIIKTDRPQPVKGSYIYGFVMRNLKFDGNADNQTEETDLLDLRFIHYGLLENIIVMNVYGTGIGLRRTFYLSMINVHTRDKITSIGVRLGENTQDPIDNSLYYNDHVVMLGCQIGTNQGGNANYGILMENVRYSLINAWIVGFTYGIYANPGAGLRYNNILLNTICESTSDTCIYVNTSNFKNNIIMGIALINTPNRIVLKTYDRPNILIDPEYGGLYRYNPTSIPIGVNDTYGSPVVLRTIDYHIRYFRLKISVSGVDTGNGETITILVKTYTTTGGGAEKTITFTSDGEYELNIDDIIGLYPTASHPLVKIEVYAKSNLSSTNSSASVKAILF